MRRYVLETETHPARGGERRGLSLNCVVTEKPPGDQVTEMSLFGVADMVDPKTNRIQDTMFTVRAYTGPNESEFFQGVASWKFDGQQFYSEITAKFGDIVVLNTIDELVTDRTKKIRLELQIPE
jgi:hypothetical protein